MKRHKRSHHSYDSSRIEKLTNEAIDETQRVIEGALVERFAVPEHVTDWWKPDAEDPFWMLENLKGEWLKNEHSALTTRDATKAIRYPSEWHADVARRRLPGSGWITFRPTEHAWIVPDASADTHPKGGDSVQHEAPSPMGSAVPEGQTPTKGFPHG